MATGMAMVTVMELKQPNCEGYRFAWLLGAAISISAGPTIAGDWKITPTLAVTETATDNVALAKDSQKQSDLISDINPGIRIEGTGGRANLRFDYQLHNLIYAQDSSRNRLQNSLNALGKLEAVENWFFIEASGSISQQSISAFGGTTSANVNTNRNGNTTETSTYRLSPYIRGSFGNFADYQLRYNLSTTSAKASSAFDSDTRELIATLKGETALANLGWSFDASSQKTDYSSGRENDSDRFRGVLTYQIDPQFRMSVTAGREANNYLTTDKESHTTKGAGLEWSPTERTLLAINRENRFFGNSNSLSFSHRTAGSTWKYSESKDVSVTPSQQFSAAATYYDLLYPLICLPLPTVAQQVSCGNSLALTPGINVLAPAGFLSSGATLQHRRELSFALLGARNTVTFSMTQSQSESLSQGSGTGFYVGTGFSNAQQIEQRGASINWSHQLTAISSLAGSYAVTNSKGSGSSSLETDQKMFSINFTTQLGPKTNAGISARRVVVDGATNYTENALTGTLSHQF